MIFPYRFTPSKKECLNDRLRWFPRRVVSTGVLESCILVKPYLLVRRSHLQSTRVNPFRTTIGHLFLYERVGRGRHGTYSVRKEPDFLIRPPTPHTNVSLCNGQTKWEVSLGYETSGTIIITRLIIIRIKPLTPSLLILLSEVHYVTLLIILEDSMFSFLHLFPHSHTHIDIFNP